MIVLQLFLFFATLLAGSMLLLNTLAICFLVVWSWIDKKGKVKDYLKATFSTWKMIAVITGCGILSWYVVGILKLVPIK